MVYSAESKGSADAILTAFGGFGGGAVCGGKVELGVGWVEMVWRRGVVASPSLEIPGYLWWGYQEH